MSICAEVLGIYFDANFLCTSSPLAEQVDALASALHTNADKYAGSPKKLNFEGWHMSVQMGGGNMRSTVEYTYGKTRQYYCKNYLVV